MTVRMLRLCPGPPDEVAVEGAYLAETLHRQGGAGRPCVYASFVSSLDGRISLHDPATGASCLPPALGSANDFRLFQELQAQADCMVTNAGYLRDLGAGRLDDVLQVNAPDLMRWRVANGLTPQPALVVVSATLDFPLPASPSRHAQRLLVATGEAAPADKVARLRARGVPVIVAGAGASVEGGALVRALAPWGFRSLYLLAGPRLFEAMLRDGMLARLYLTTTHSLLGGTHFQTMLSGGTLGEAGRLRMAALYHDPGAPDGTSQWFARFDTVR